MRRVFTSIGRFLSDHFNLNEDKADEAEIIDAIKRNVTFYGTNLWTLIFAIFIASIGLNVNSTAVIIGAMLISPLMGPIMGIGLSIGTNDFDLLKKGVKNLALAALISILTSFLYFSISPLQKASSELLARTNPSLWDVFIAFFGGLAGIVAGTRKEKSNVIPGVAIATALMPPLCTAGYALATLNFYYFVGALYLFFINSLFICFATILIVRHLKFHKHQFASPEIERRVSRTILAIVILTVLPSIYLTYRIVDKAVFERNAERFISSEFKMEKTIVLTQTYSFDANKKTIELLLIGESLPDSIINAKTLKLDGYGLKNTRLLVRQGLGSREHLDLSEVKSSILQEVFAAEQKIDSVSNENIEREAILKSIQAELHSLFPEIVQYSLQNAVFTTTDSIKNDTVTLLLVKVTKHLSKSDSSRLNSWLKQKLNTDSVKILNY